MAAKASLAFLFVVGIIVGIWALTYPLGFYNVFPAYGHPWVSSDGPYNEHLVRDVGALNCSLGVLAGLSFLRPALVAPFTVGVVTLVYNLAHFIYHISNVRLYSSIDQAGNAIALGAALLASLVLVSRGGTIRRASTS